LKTLLALAALLLAGCTISTELDPGGFQSWRRADRGVTGSNLPRRSEVEADKAQGEAPKAQAPNPGGTEAKAN